MIINEIVVPISIIGSIISISCAVLLVLTYLKTIIRNYKINKTEYEKSPVTHDVMDAILERMTELMKDSEIYKNPDLRIDDVAKRLNIPKMYISQTTNKKLGINFYEYINRYRIEEAINYMNNNDISIIELAFQVGFNNLSSFYKYFKKQTGVSPSKFPTSTPE